jgi:hypothetical protein
MFVKKLLKSYFTLKTLKNQIVPNNEKVETSMFLNSKKQIKKAISYNFIFFKYFVRRMYLKGYNYRLKFLKKKRYIRLYLGAPLSWVVPFPKQVKIKRLRKKFFKFIGSS